MADKAGRRTVHIKWSEAQENWLRSCWNDYGTVAELTHAFNVEFHTERTANSVRQRARKLGIMFGPSPEMYTEDENAFLLDNYGKHTFRELADMLNERFGRKVTWYGLRSHMYTGLGKKLDNPGVFAYRWKRQPVGTESDLNGYTMVKVADRVGKRGSHEAERENWILKQRYVYEKAYGPIPEDSQIVFLDGNKKNFDLRNLYCMKKRYLSFMRSNHWFSDNPEVTLAAIKWCELHYAIQDVEVNENERSKVD